MVAKRDAGNGTPRRRPATTPEMREQQLGALAYDLAEKQILNGTVSSAVLTHFLKINSIREKKELLKLEHETRLTEAKIASSGQADRMEALMNEAMRAFTEYRGGDVDDYDED